MTAGNWPGGTESALSNGSFDRTLAGRTQRCEWRIRARNRALVTKAGPRPHRDDPARWPCLSPPFIRPLPQRGIGLQDRAKGILRPLDRRRAWPRPARDERALAAGPQASTAAAPRLWRSRADQRARITAPQAAKASRRPARSAPIAARPPARWSRSAAVLEADFAIQTPAAGNRACTMWAADVCSASSFHRHHSPLRRNAPAASPIAPCRRENSGKRSLGAPARSADLVMQWRHSRCGGTAWRPPARSRRGALGVQT